MKLNNATAGKIFGWILLLGGVATIGWTLLNAYNIFTGKVDAPQILKLETKSVTSVPVPGASSQDIDIQKQVEGLIEEQLKGILPANSVPTLMNLIISSVLAGILIFGGSQISSLGIRLIIMK